MTEIQSIASPGVAGLSPYLPGKPLSELEREYGIRDAVKLASNENPLGASPLVASAIEAQLSDLGRYPDGNGFELKAALAKSLDVAPERITLGNGSNDILDLIGRAFLAPGRSAVYSEYGFVVYPIAIQAAGAVAHVAPARDFGHDLSAMRECVDDNTTLVFIANPNNPTGTYLPSADLEGFIRDLPERVMVVVDEAYFEYVDQPDYPNALDWIDRYPNLIVTRTFSKIHSLAALRLGYSISHPEVADLLNRVRHPFNVNSLAQAAGLAALADVDHVKKSRDSNFEGLATLNTLCQELGLAAIPSVGNFLTIDVGRPGGEVYEALLHKGVIVRPVVE
ncbi:MAG: histidinol-phosphate transaminase, partial [Gammaproteobacteria bacterium]